MDLSMRNKIIMEVFQGNYETRDLTGYLGCSERYAQSVKKELKNISALNGILNFIPICSVCYKTCPSESNIVMNKDWKSNINKIISVFGWRFDKNGFFFCDECNKKFEKESLSLSSSASDVFDTKSNDVKEEEMSKKHKRKRINVVNSVESDSWEVKLDCVKECSKAPEAIDIYLSSIVISKIRLFMSWAGSKEWLAYLQGEKDNDSNKIFVSNLLLPKQSASSALVHDVECSDYKDIVGVIHSHHEMGGANDVHKPGFSGHDEAFINGNHGVSLLVAKDGIAGFARVVVSCGAFKRVKVNIHKMVDDRIDKEILKKEFDEKVSFVNNQVNENWRNNYTYVDQSISNEERDIQEEDEKNENNGGKKNIAHYKWDRNNYHFVRRDELEIG
jgi:hypothetical protein